MPGASAGKWNKAILLAAPVNVGTIPIQLKELSPLLFANLSSGSERAISRFYRAIIFNAFLSYLKQNRTA